MTPHILGPGPCLNTPSKCVAQANSCNRCRPADTADERQLAYCQFTVLLIFVGGGEFFPCSGCSCERGSPEAASVSLSPGEDVVPSSALLPGHAASSPSARCGGTVSPAPSPSVGTKHTWEDSYKGPANCLGIH